MHWFFFALLSCTGPQTETDTDGVDTDTDDTTVPEEPVVIPLYARAVEGGTGALVVSNGVPFPQGWVASTDELVLAEGGVEIALYTDAISTWADGSVKSALIQFEHESSALPAQLTLTTKGARTTADRSAVPIDWTLPAAVAYPDAAWLTATGAFGPLVPHGTAAFASTWESRAVSGFDDLKGDADWGDDVRYDGYYSTSLTWYLLFLQTGDTDTYSWARRELVHYRDDQIEASGQMNGRTEPRYLYLRAMEADWLLNGDPETAVVAGRMATYLSSNWDDDWYFYAASDENFWTERRSAFPLLGTVVYARSFDRSAMAPTHGWVDNLLATQAEHSQGGYIHHLYAHDSDECPDVGAYGGSPFMTGLLYEALTAYHGETGDARIVDSVVAANDWMWDAGWDESGFSYLIGCPTSQPTAPDLNLLIAHGYAFACAETGESRHCDRAEQVFDHGVSEAYLGARKQYNQNYRSSPAYVAWMARSGE